jgi:hypothetical protein
MLIVLLYALIVVLAVVFVAVTALFVREQFRLRPLVVMKTGRPRELIIPPQDTVTAISAAEERRKFIIQRVGSGVPFIEVIELPPNSGEIALDGLTAGEAVGQAVTLRWQLNDDAFLLLGRVVDALTVVARRLEIEPWRLASNVKLARFKPAKTFFGFTLYSQRVFPYMVLIDTNDEQTIRKEISHLGSWFGIGVAVQRAPQTTEFGQCTVPGGLPGCVGGDIRSLGDVYALTCRHVVSARCSSAVFKTDLRSRTNEPDVALLDIETPCFKQCFTRPAQAIEFIPVDEGLPNC